VRIRRPTGQGASALPGRNKMAPNKHTSRSTTTETTSLEAARMTRAQRAVLPLAPMSPRPSPNSTASASGHWPCAASTSLTNRVEIVPVPCASTREDQCRPCADKVRRLTDDPMPRRIASRHGTAHQPGQAQRGPQGADGYPRHSMTPGRCKGNAHKLEHLGIAGRRILVSRKWSNKALDDHRTERGEFVRQLLQRAGIQPSHGLQGGPYQWERPAPTIPSRPLLLLHAVAERQRWKAEYVAAQLAVNDAPDEGVRQLVIKPHGAGDEHQPSAPLVDCRRPIGVSRHTSSDDSWMAR
jgi:hypothetical protein